MLAIGAGEQQQLPRGVRGIGARSWVPTNLGWSVDGLPRAARRMAFDVFHAPAYTAPLWGVHPLVVTLHDVSYERRPEWYPYRGDRLRRWFYRRSALSADLVITDSDGKCLCSSSLKQESIAGKFLNLWARFPAPPAGVKEVSVVFPHFIPTDAPIGN